MSRLKLSVCMGSDHAMVPYGLMEVCVLTHTYTHNTYQLESIFFVSASETYLGSVSWEFFLQHCLAILYIQCVNGSIYEHLIT